MVSLKIEKEIIFISFLKTLIVSIIGGILAVALHVPVPWMLGPLIIVVIMSRFGVHLYWPSRFRDLALIIVGYSLGISFTSKALVVIIRHLPMIFLMTILLIVLSLGVAFVISRCSGIDFSTILMSSTPGGISQMIILAEEIKGINVSIVTFFQVLRMVIIIIFVPILVYSPLVGIDDTGVSTIFYTSTTIFDIYPKILVFIPVAISGILIAKKVKFPTPVLVGPLFFTALLGLLGYRDRRFLHSF